MLFYDPLFLTVFPLFFAIYWLAIARRAVRKCALLIASAVFYIWGEPLFVPLLLASSAFDYVLSRYLTESTIPRWRKAALVTGIASNLGILILYKYADFLAQNLNLLGGMLYLPKLSLLQIVMPIGVSFVVFEKITYLVDTYRGLSQPAARLTDYFLFVLFFPKLLAGPILKYHEMATQLVAPSPIEPNDVSVGALRFARGLGRKLLIADPAGEFANQIFAADPANLGADSAWLGLLAFTLQIYFDFSGYSDMAIGLARMLGFRLNENFNAPYASRSITEFWQRWHISLTSWIRDYLYVPLGGNRAGPTRTIVNLWLCFLASGLWHGASWNFLLWGAYNGLFLMLDRLFLARALVRMGPVVATASTFLIVMIGWAIFRSETLTHLQAFLGALAGAAQNTLPETVQASVVVTLVIGLVIALFPATPMYGVLARYDHTDRKVRVLTAAIFGMILMLAVSRALTQTFQPFIYFRF